MTRQRLLEETSSADLSGYLALFAVHQEEHEMQRHRLEAGDGQVYIQGHADDSEDEDDDGDDSGP